VAGRKSSSKPGVLIDVARFNSASQDHFHRPGLFLPLMCGCMVASGGCDREGSAMKCLFLLARFALVLGLGASVWAGIASAQVHYGPNAKPPSGGVVGKPGTGPDPAVSLNPPARTPGPGTPIYNASECIGAVVNGVCNGTVIDTEPMRPRCHGTLLPDGSCTGPVF